MTALKPILAKDKDGNPIVAWVVPEAEAAIRAIADPLGLVKVTGLI